MLSGSILLENNYHIKSVIEKPTYDPLQEGYDFLLENETYSHDLSIRYMKLLIEASENPYVLNEGFSDIISKCIEGIKKFINWVGEQFKKLIDWIKGCITTDKKISDTKVNDLDKSVTVTIEGYKYTISKFIKSMEDLTENNNMSGYGEISNFVVLASMSAEELKTRYTEFKDISSSQISKIRGKILLNKDIEISKDEFNDKIFSLLRNNKSEKETIKYNFTDIKNLQVYVNEEYPKFIKTMNGVKEKILTKFNRELKRLQEFKSSYNKIDGGDPNKIEIFNAYMTQSISVKNQEKEIYISLISNICKAIKDAYSQAKSVINQASVQDTKERFHIKDGDD